MCLAMSLGVSGCLAGCLGGCVWVSGGLFLNIGRIHGSQMAINNFNLLKRPMVKRTATRVFFMAAESTVFWRYKTTAWGGQERSPEKVFL